MSNTTVTPVYTVEQARDKCNQAWGALYAFANKQLGTQKRPVLVTREEETG